MKTDSFFSIFYTENDTVFVYDKRSGVTYSLKKATFKSLLESGKLESTLRKASSSKNQDSSQWYARKVFYFDEVTLPWILTFFFELIIVYLSIPFFISAIVLLFHHGFNISFSIYSVLCLIVSIFFAHPIGLILHELSHAVIAKKIGLFVPEFAIGIRRNFSFYAYTRLVGMDNCSNLLDKVKIYYAGIGMNFFLASIFFLAYSLLNINSFGILLFGIIFTLQALINLNLFFGGDGYLIIKSIFPNCNLPK